MASPAKKQKSEDDSMEGYLHKLSPVKTSKRNGRYFNATLQSGREQYNTVVVFAPKKHTMFHQAALTRSPVKLTKVRRRVSYNNPAVFDVFCSGDCNLDVVLNVPFFWRPPSEAGVMSITNILALGAKQQVAAVRAKILPGGVEIKIVIVEGVECELMEFRICDKSGECKLTLWEEKIMKVEVSKCYELTHLVTRKLNDCTVLSSTLSTTICEIGDVGQPEFLQPSHESTELSTLHGNVGGVSILGKQRCVRCHRSQVDFREHCVSHRCDGCKMLLKPQFYSVCYSGTLLVLCDGEEHTLRLTNSVVCKLVSEYLGGHVRDVGVIEERLMTSEEIKVQVNQSEVVVSLVLDEGNGGPSSQAEESWSVENPEGQQPEDDNLVVSESEVLCKETEGLELFDEYL